MKARVFVVKLGQNIYGKFSFPGDGFWLGVFLILKGSVFPNRFLFKETPTVLHHWCFNSSLLKNGGKLEDDPNPSLLDRPERPQSLVGFMLNNLRILEHS